MGTSNLARLAAEALDRLGDHPAVCYSGRWHSSGELHARAVRFGAGLREMGIGPGDRVIVIMPNRPEVLVAYTGIWRAGAVATPVLFVLSAPELRHVLGDSGAAAVITSAEVLPLVRHAGASDLSIPVIVAGLPAPEPGPKPALVDFAEVERCAPSELVDRRGDDLAALLYTGGTTGRSKGVPLSHTNLSSGAAASRSVSYTPGLSRSLLPLPLAHSYGLLVTVGGMHATEPGRTVLMSWFEPTGWLDLAQEHRVQVAAVVPSMLAMLLAQPLERYDLSGLRHVFCGAAPLPEDVLREFERRVPSAVVLEGYGCTETGGIISSTPPAARRVGTVGRPIPGVTVRIVGVDGTEVPPGSDGEVVVRGPNVMSGYWSEQPHGDEWFGTGDIGRMDADGYLSIVDRKKDLIIRGGYNVYPRDVEDVLISHPAVAGAAVVGRPDPRLGEEIVAFVALRDGQEATADHLVAYARERLAATKYPRDIRIVERIPLTSVGKVDRKALRATVIPAAPPG